MIEYEWAVRYEQKVLGGWMTVTSDAMTEEESDSLCNAMFRFELENPKLYRNTRQVKRLISDWQELNDPVDHLLDSREGLALANAAWHEGFSAAMTAVRVSEDTGVFTKPNPPYSAPLLKAINNGVDTAD